MPAAQRRGAASAAGRLRRWWLLTRVAFSLMGTAWALALPVNGTYDEKQHIVRAYAVAAGHLLPGDGDAAADSLGRRIEAFPVPGSLLPTTASVDCTWWQPPRPATCQRWVRDRSVTMLPTVAARYSPVYSLAVGAPLVVSPTPAGIVAARVISALPAAALLAGAMAAALRQGRRLLVVAVVLVATPLAVNLNGAVNPNGLETAAGVALCCALLGAGSAAWWLWYSHGVSPMPPRQLPRLTPAGQLRQLALHRGPFWLKQLVAQFSFGETDVTPVVVVGWYLLFAAVAVPAPVLAGARARAAVMGLAGCGIGLLERRLAGTRWLVPLVAVLTAATVPLHLVALAARARPGRPGLPSGASGHHDRSMEGAPVPARTQPPGSARRV